MPHKRAKRSAREQLRQERVYNLAPERQSLSNEPIPKSVTRVINAVKIREQWKSNSKKRELEQREDKEGFKRQKIHHRKDDDGSVITATTPSSQLKIQPGESIQQFNRRVEDGVQPILRSAIQATRTTIRRNARGVKKDRQNASKTWETSSRIGVPGRNGAASATSNRTSKPVSAPPKGFAKFSADVPKRLNDVAQAPPVLPPLSRRAKRQWQEPTTGCTPELPPQRPAMNKERDAVIRRYRLLKERRRRPHVAEDGTT